MDKYLARVLFIDLSAHRYWVEERGELFRARLGGTGVAVELLHELCPAGADPLASENPVILAVGPLSALFPLASKTVALFKSPHTGNLGESHCGGRSAVSLRLAGYGAVVITGKSDIPIYLVIDGEKVHFRDARALWGLSSSFTVGRIIREREGGSGTRSILRIGIAGENLVTYANVVAESYRHVGRLGLGAVFGAKKLKAVVIISKGRVPVADPPGYSRLYRELHERAVHSELFRKYHDLGTMLGGEDPEGFLRLMDTVEHLGLDAMSCGVALAWATEAFERGLITDRDTGGLVPKWGDYGVYREMVWRIARGDGELYEHLAGG